MPYPTGQPRSHRRQHGAGDGVANQHEVALDHGPDIGTHLTEPHDLWTSRAPAAYRDRVPRVLDVDGTAMWTVEDTPLGRASASSVVHKDGSRCRGTDFISWTFDDAHPAAYDVPARLEVM